jgi:hypothetical protein
MISNAVLIVNYGCKKYVLVALSAWLEPNLDGCVSYHGGVLLFLLERCEPHSNAVSLRDLGPAWWRDRRCFEKLLCRTGKDAPTFFDLYCWFLRNIQAAIGVGWTTALYSPFPPAA